MWSYSNKTWHGRTQKEFQRLHLAMRKTIHIVEKCKSEKQITRFIRWHKHVYEQYYKEPIRVRYKNGEYYFMGDGRHRILMAQMNKSLIPVFVFENSEEYLAYEEFKKRVFPGSWVFLKNEK